MDRTQDLVARPPTARLPLDLRLYVLSFLPPNDLALGGRLSCKEENLCYREPVYRTASLSRPLPGHVVDTAWCLEGAQEAMQQLTFGQKLMTLSIAAASGCEANVEFTWRLLQPHVFPELLHTDHYRRIAFRDLGSAAVVGGLAHLLPSLARRCPGLLDPGATLEAAARHCDLAGLQAAWGAVGQRLQGYIPRLHGTPWETWRRVLCAAAGSPTPDALAKMEWALEKGRAYGRLPLQHADVCGAAAASGDLARLAWLRDRGFAWATAAVIAALVRHADLGLFQQLEQEGGYLSPVEFQQAWASEGMVTAAAASPRDSIAKLQWLAGRGADLGSREALRAAAACGNLEAVQLLAAQGAPAWGDDAFSVSIFDAAVASGSVPVATWLRQAGCPWGVLCFRTAFCKGDLPMVRWLLEAGCPWEQNDSLCGAVDLWPCLKPGDSCRLVEAVRLLAAAGWPVATPEQPVALEATVWAGHPWSVLHTLLGLQSADVRDMGIDAAVRAAKPGCGATLHALVGAGVLQAHRGNRVVLRYGDGGTGAYSCDLAQAWYGCAAAASDRGTLACLRQLGVPLQSRVLAGAVRQAAPLPALSWLVDQHGRWRVAKAQREMIELWGANSYAGGGGVQLGRTACTVWCICWVLAVLAGAAAVVRLMGADDRVSWPVYATIIMIGLFARGLGQLPT